MLEDQSMTSLPERSSKGGHTFKDLEEATS